MTTLRIPNLPAEVHARLHLRAAANGRSVESEAIEILATACVGERYRSDARELPSWVDGLYGDTKPSNVVEDLIAARRREAE